MAVADESASALLRTGKQLFDTSCVTCHGVNLQGVTDRGPSLIGVGEAAVYFQVSTGRMPAMRGEAQAPQKQPQFDETQIDALGAYVQANGGGPVVPRADNGQVAQQSLVGDDVARGGDLFRLNCASCHNFTGKGGALSSGKYAPDLSDAEPGADLHRDADRPAEHAEVLRPSALPRREARHRRLRADGSRDAGPRRLRPRRVRTHARRAWPPGSSGSWPSSGRPCGSEPGHDATRRTPPRARTPRPGLPGQPSDAELASMSREELRRARRQARRRRDRLQGSPLAGAGHQGREARRALGGVLASARRPFGLALLLIFLFWPWEYKPHGRARRLVVLAGHPALRPDVRPVDPGDRRRRGAVPEEVHPRRDLHPGPPRRPRPPRSSARPSRPT